MNLKELEISFHSQILILNNQRSLYWEKEQALVIADLHLGKAAHFRKNGIAIPTQVSDTDLNRLAELLSHYQPKKLITVGDFVHAQSSLETASFHQLRNRFPEIEFFLIKGNHDQLSDECFKSLGIDIVCNSMQIENLFFLHEAKNTDKPTIAGHIHPGVFIQLPTKKNVKLPCFVVEDKILILPAFSQFTGMNTGSISTENSIYYPFNEEFIFQL